MKILMLLEHKFPGDIRVDKEVKSLYQKDIKVDVAIYTKEKKGLSKTNYKWGNVYSKYISKTHIKFSALSLSFPFYFSFWESFIKDILKNNSYDYIHLHDLPLIKVALKISKQFNIPLTVDLHENRPEIMKLYNHVNSFPGKILISLKKWNLYQKKYIGEVDNLILITPEAKKYYAEKLNVNSNKIYVVPNYINFPLILDKVEYKLCNKLKKKKTVVYFGDMSIRRGIIEVIEVAKIQKNNPIFHFVFIGNGSGLNTLKNIKNKYSLKNVDVLGFIPIEKALKIISSCSIGICPFHRNIHHDTTYANKMFQYMALGLPLIVSDCPSQAIVVEKEMAGVIFKAGNTNDLNKKLIELTENEFIFNEISERIRQIVPKKYNWDIAAKELLKIYKK